MTSTTDPIVCPRCSQLETLVKHLGQAIDALYDSVPEARAQYRTMIERVVGG